MAKESSKKQTAVNNGPMGYVLFMAWVGALVYFVGRVDGLWNIIVAFFKACVWPAYLLYHVFLALNV